MCFFVLASFMNSTKGQLKTKKKQISKIINNMQHFSQNIIASGVQALIIILLLSLHAELSMCVPLDLPSDSSIVYVVKFVKATPDELKYLTTPAGINSNKKVLSQVQFLQKLVRNTNDVLNQAVFYVNFTVSQPNANFSNIQIKTNSSASSTGAINNISSNNTVKVDISNNKSNSSNITSNISKSTNISTNITTDPFVLLGSSGLQTTSQPPIANKSLSSSSLLNITLNTSSPSSSSSSSSSLSSSSSSSSISSVSNTSTNTNLDPIVIAPPPAVTQNSYPNIASANFNVQTITTPAVKKKPILLSRQVRSTQFTGVSLYHQIPINFTKNQVYRFNGIITDIASVFVDSQQTGGYIINFVNVIFSKVQSSQQVKCVQKVTKKQLQFDISCKLRLTGNFYVSIFAGGTGYSSSLIRVVNQIPKFYQPTTLPQNPDSLYLTISQGDLYVNWNVVSPLAKITFSQLVTIGPSVNNSVQYILSNFHTSFRVPHCDFLLFQQGITNISISYANSRDSTLTGINSLFGNILILKFNAVQHMHSNNQDGTYNFVPEFPDQVQLNKTYNYSVFFSVDVQNQIYLVTPYDQIRKIYFRPNSSENILAAGAKLNISIKIVDEGTNLIQINQDTGLAVINQAIYAGDVYPLLPDYSDIKIQSLIDKTDTLTAIQKYMRVNYPRTSGIKQPPKGASLTQKRNYLLTLLNLLRTRQIVQPIYLDGKLTQIAQSHSDDMKLNNYFSHTSLNNLGPGDRAKQMGFTGAIGQNIAQSSSLVQAHLSLQRSAAHFENSISPTWTRVGIGINETNQGLYLITFQFSSRDIVKDPLSNQQIDNHKKVLTAMLLRKYTFLKSEDMQVSGFVKQWMLSSRNLPLTPYILSRGVNSNRQISSTSIRFTYYPDFVGEIEKSSNIFGSITKYNQFGVGVNVTKYDASLMQCFFVFLT